MMINRFWTYLLLSILLSAGCAKNPSSGCQEGFCQASIESGSQTYRFSLNGGNGILEKRENSGVSWISAAEKPEVEGYTVSGVFGLNENILVTHCDASGNRRMLKFDPHEENWSATRFQTGGCN